MNFEYCVNWCCFSVAGKPVSSSDLGCNRRFSLMAMGCVESGKRGIALCPASAGNGKWRPSVNINGENACERNESITVQTKRLPS